MKASTVRPLYEILFWGLTAGLLYVNRDLYETTRNILEPIFQAYTQVAVIVSAIFLTIFILYLHEAIANSAIALTRRATGDRPLDYEKGNLGRNIRKTARRMERKGNFQAAGETYESLEQWREAAHVYERGNLFGRAANAAKQEGNIGKAVELYEKDHNYEAAGKLCKSEGLPDRATRNFRLAAELSLDQNRYARAAELYELASDFKQAASIFENLKKTDKALTCYEKVGDTDKILELVRSIHTSEYLSRGDDFSLLVQRAAEKLISNGQTNEGAEILESCHAYTRAAEVYANCKMWQKSAELYLKADQAEMAEKMVANIEEKSAASEISAKLAIRKGDWKSAGMFYEEANKQNLAIDAFKKARDFDSAARIYESMGRYIMAGEMYSSSRNFKSAATAFSKAYDWRNAAECFEECGESSQAIEAYANAGNFLKAGKLALNMTDYARAVEYLQRIPPASSDFQVATGFLATAFFYQNNFDMSLELFRQVMGELPLNRDNLAIHYAYARQLESMEPKKSLTLFRQILGIDVHYSDVSKRIEDLERIITSISTGFANTPSSIPEPKIKAEAPLHFGQNKFQIPPGSIGNTPSSARIKRDVDDKESPNTATLDPAPISQKAETPAVLDGRYQVKDELAQNGRVSDYNAIDTISGNHVVLRTFPRPENELAYKSTMSLLSSISEMTHTGINRLLSFGETETLVYAVYSTTGGHNLKQFIRSNGPLSVTETSQMFGDLLETLEFAHSHDICHLNLRPEMVYVVPDVHEKIVIAGFGVPVRQPQNTELIYLTMPDSDPQYLAPEQIIGTDVDCRTDIYAFGLLMFFVLTGRTPFEVKRVNETQEIARMQVQTSLPRPSTIRATLPSVVDEIFLRCVNKSALARYQSVSELLTDVSGLRSGTLA